MDIKYEEYSKRFPKTATFDLLNRFVFIMANSLVWEVIGITLDGIRLKATQYIDGSVLGSYNNNEESFIMPNACFDRINLLHKEFKPTKNVEEKSNHDQTTHSRVLNGYWKARPDK